MSVSDPLLKKLKGHVYKLRTDPDQIRNDHWVLVAFCETLECILRKGIKQSSSVFGMARRDYWMWVEQLAATDGTVRFHPGLGMAVDAVKMATKVTTVQGRGRLFLRYALQKKLVAVAVEQLARQDRIMQGFYNADMSILGDEILREILLSLLFEVNDINFNLDLSNASFLDDTWMMPVVLSHEFVPTMDLGLHVQHFKGRVIVSSLEPGGVAADCGKLEPGDVLDELLRHDMRKINRGKISALLRRNKGFPVRTSFIKCRQEDGSLFPPIGELLRQAGRDTDHPLIQPPSARPAPPPSSRPAPPTAYRKPPQALLPDEEFDEIPVHNSEDTAQYTLVYMGKHCVGEDGGVHQIEKAVETVVTAAKAKAKESSSTVGQEVLFETGETDVVSSDVTTNEEIMRHSYTEIASCGRRIDMLQYFSYIAGETTCTLAKKFFAYVFKANDEEEVKTILCSIAQGFDRTHWYV